MSPITVDDLELISLPENIAENGSLMVIEGIKNIPFEIARIFFVNANQGAVRGEHSHIECAQFLVCLSGKIEVICDDGKMNRVFILEDSSVGLLIPPGIWASQHYKSKSSVLAVLCDQIYTASDYIRDYGAFIASKRNIID